MNEFHKKIIALEAENMYLRTSNKNFQNKINDLEETIIELMEHNTTLGTTLINNIEIPINYEDNPLEHSIIFDDENENNQNNQNNLNNQNKKKSQLQKLAHKYKKVIYALNKLSSTYSACSTAIHIGKYLALLLI